MKQNLKKFKDFDYSCALMFGGLDLVKVEWANKTAHWTFDDQENKADQIINAFINKKLNGNIYEFVEVQKSMKKAMMN